MCAQSSDSDRYTEIRNAKARRDFFIEDKFEAGIALRGTGVSRQAVAKRRRTGRAAAGSARIGAGPAATTGVAEGER